MTDFEKALKWLTVEKTKREKRFNDSYNPQTRYRNLEQIDVIDTCITALHKWKRLSDYVELENRCEKKYGKSISKLINE